MEGKGARPVLTMGGGLTGCPLPQPRAKPTAYLMSHHLLAHLPLVCSHVPPQTHPVLVLGAPSTLAALLLLYPPAVFTPSAKSPRLGSSAC